MDAETIKKFENIDIEIPLLLEAIYQKYSYDFRDYSKTHIKRRLLNRLSLDRLESISQMQDKALRDKEFFKELLCDLSINVTEMFRDPDFYLSFRKNVVPVLRTYPYIKIWHAGCSTGEEVYSLAILLKEENLLDRCQIYATDFNRRVLETAKKGIYSIDHINTYQQNYLESGGLNKLSDYYTAKYGSIKFDHKLARKIVFADHNLATDHIFAEVNLIMCRNVLIYFNKNLQIRVLNLFKDSLCRSGFLCLGTKETIRFTNLTNCFNEIDCTQKIYKKKTKLC